MTSASVRLRSGDVRITVLCKMSAILLSPNVVYEKKHYTNALSYTSEKQEGEYITLQHKKTNITLQIDDLGRSRITEAYL